jgi:hypothetical protein
MTCREFKHSASALTLWELARVEDSPVRAHADSCETCGTWLRKQSSLASSMRTLQARSAGLEAGPQVERALLQEVRRAAAARAALAPAVMPRHTDPAPRMALRLSRFFEVGAYAAVAAALAVGIFLGIELMQHRARTNLAQTASAPVSVLPAAQKPESGAQGSMAKATPNSSELPTAVSAGATPRLRRAVSRGAVLSRPQAAEEDSSSASDAGYIALMFCDPLSCSSDSQVVRMELPSPAGQDAQPQMADVIVGYDGVVRAVRMVN